LLQVRSVVETNLATLREAELAIAEGNRDSAARGVQRFEQIWPVEKLPLQLRSRVDALRATLDNT
jgi:hypothetical protein